MVYVEDFTTPAKLHDRCDTSNRILISPAWFTICTFSLCTSLSDQAFDHFSTSTPFRAAFLRPLQQQIPQHVPICIRNPTKSNATAVHSNANILMPSSALMFNSVTSAKAFLNITNMTVAMTAPAAVKSRARNVRIVIGSDRKNTRLALWDHRGFCE